MSKITFVEQTVDPATPAAGRGVMYLGSAGTLFLRDDTGTITQIGGGVVRISVTNIDDPSIEINPLSGVGDGDLLLAYELIPAGDDKYTLYSWEASPSGLESVPFSVDGASGGRWNGIAGRNTSQETRIEAQNNQIRFDFDTFASLPAPATVQGMFAHVNDTSDPTQGQRAYHAHIDPVDGAVWLEIQDFRRWRRTALAGTEIDFAGGDRILTKTLASNTVLTIINPLLGDLVTLEISSTAGETLTFPGSVVILSGSYDTSGATNYITIKCSDDATPVYLVSIDQAGTMDFLPISDDLEIIKNVADGTKRIRFSAASISTGTTRVLTMPDKDVTVDDASDPRTPTAHESTHEDGGTDELPVDTLAEAAAPSNDTSRALRPDGVGGVAFSDVAHSDLTGVGTDDHHLEDHQARHADGGADELTVDALAEAAIPGNDVSQALRPDGVGGVAFSDVAHSDLTGVTSDQHHAQDHASRHTNGSDDIQDATAGQKGLATTTQITKLDGIETGAQVNTPHRSVLGFGASNVGSTTTTRFLRPWDENSQAPTSAIPVVVPYSGTLKNLFVRHTTGAGNGADIVYTVSVNGTPSSVTVSIASTGTAVVSDTSNSVAVSAGDLVTIEVTKAASVGASPIDIVSSVELES